MQKLKTPKDVVEATNALINWFSSQDITPRDGLYMCLLLIAEMIDRGVTNKQKALGLLNKLIDAAANHEDDEENDEGGF